MSCSSEATFAAHRNTAELHRSVCSGTRGLPMFVRFLFGLLVASSALAGECETYYPFVVGDTLEYSSFGNGRETWIQGTDSMVFRRDTVFCVQSITNINHTWVYTSRYLRYVWVTGNEVHAKNGDSADVAQLVGYRLYPGLPGCAFLDATCMAVGGDSVTCCVVPEVSFTTVTVPWSTDGRDSTTIDSCLSIVWDTYESHMEQIFAQGIGLVYQFGSWHQTHSYEERQLVTAELQCSPGHIAVNWARLRTAPKRNARRVAWFDLLGRVSRAAQRGTLGPRIEVGGESPRARIVVVPGPMRSTAGVRQE